MAKTNERSEQVRAVIDVSLDEVKAYEKETGKNFSNMSPKEKIDFVRDLLATKQAECYDTIKKSEPLTFEITATFITTDPEIENKRRKHKARIANIINIILISLLGAGIFGAGLKSKEIIDFFTNNASEMPNALATISLLLILVNGTAIASRFTENFSSYYTDAKGNALKKEKGKTK